MSALEIAFIVVAPLAIIGGLIIDVRDRFRHGSLMMIAIGATICSFVLMSMYSKDKTPSALISSKEAYILDARMEDYIFIIDYRDPDSNEAKTVRFSKIADFEKYQRSGKLVKNHYKKEINFGHDWEYSIVEIK